MYAEVTMAMHDLNGFVCLGTITEQQFLDAPKGERDIDENHSLILDLWHDGGTIDDKSISLSTAASLLGWSESDLIQRGRQKYAQFLDDLAALDETSEDDMEIKDGWTTFILGAIFGATVVALIFAAYHN